MEMHCVKVRESNLVLKRGEGREGKKETNWTCGNYRILEPNGPYFLRERLSSDAV